MVLHLFSSLDFGTESLHDYIYYFRFYIIEKIPFPYYDGKFRVKF